MNDISNYQLCFQHNQNGGEEVERQVDLGGATTPRCISATDVWAWTTAMTMSPCMHHPPARPTRGPNCLLRVSRAAFAMLAIVLQP